MYMKLGLKYYNGNSLFNIYNVICILRFNFCFVNAAVAHWCFKTSNSMSNRQCGAFLFNFM